MSVALISCGVGMLWLIAALTDYSGLWPAWLSISAGHFVVATIYVYMDVRG